MLKISNVCKVFDKHTVLNNVSLEIKKSTIVGLAGPSGGGKSTLLRCIQKLETLDSGSIECDLKLGFMFQDFQLFPHMTVLKNLIYSPSIKDRHTDFSEKAKEILKNLGIENKINEFPKRLSGGQKQRVALARSLMMNPEVLLCDEPTSGLDVSTTSDVIKLLQSVRDMGVTMIIASHDLDFLTQIADRIVLLKNGNIELDVNPQELMDPVEHLKGHY